MYVRPSNTGARTIKLPENYSGNAFTEDFIRDNADTQKASEETPELEERKPWNSDSFSASEEKIEETKEEQNGEADNAESQKESEECSAVPKKRSLFGNLGFGFDLGKLFGNFGFEELLIIGLIFLISQSEGNEDIILLLILLFFIN